MFMQKRVALQPLIESRDGHHLTIYLVNQDDSQDLRNRLSAALQACEEQLEPVLKPAELMEFIRPVQELLDDVRFLQNFKGNIGIFRNSESFRVLKIPVQVEFFSGVATSYHVKPLLRWLQLDREFILINLEPGAYHVYQGGQHSLRRLATRPTPVATSSYRHDTEDVVSWLSSKLASLPQGSRPQLFIAGKRSLRQAVCKQLQRLAFLRLDNIRVFDQNKLGEIYFEIRRLLRQDAIRELEQAFIEYQCAGEVNRIGNTVHGIAQAAVQGRVRKLIIAHGVNVFGKLNQETGEVSIHSRDLDHEDDDILDDLAQIVLAKGGEVIIASRHEMPNGKLALAIYQHEDEPLAVGVESSRTPHYPALANVT